MKRLIVIAVAAIATASFAAKPEPYQPAPDINSPGYSTAPADEGRFTVVYTGVKGMSKAKVAEFALLRAAELTAESGKEWFAVIDTKSQRVKLQPGKENLDERAGGGFVTGEGAGTGAGGQGGTSRGDPMTRGGPSTGGFGGGDVPYQVLERWQPPSVHQTVIVIEMGSGDKAEFKGVTKAPQIFPAKTTAEEIRGKMKK